jgi:hypothetical protein
MDRIPIDVAMVDWLRVTSWQPIRKGPYDQPPDERKKVKRRQYRGFMWDGVFHGVGFQKGRNHFMSEATGAKAQDVYKEYGPDLTCTRLDLQVTRRAKWDIISQAELELGRAQWKHKPRKTRLIKNTNKQDTLYIGSRKNSPIFIRIYAKGLPDEQLVRFEVELKDDWSVGTWAGIHEGVTLGELVSRHIYALPNVPSLRVFKEWAHQWESFIQDPPEMADTKRRWIEQTCIPALWKEAGNHGDKEWMIDELSRLLVYLSESA